MSHVFNASLDDMLPNIGLTLYSSPCDILLALSPMTSNRTARRIISRIQHREPAQSMLRKVPARLYVRWSARCDTNNISTKQR